MHFTYAKIRRKYISLINFHYLIKEVFFGLMIKSKQFTFLTKKHQSISLEVPREIIEPWSISMLPKDPAMITVNQVKQFRFFCVILKLFCEYISLAPPGK